ncbi:hypothetical protein [Clavibacter zhangzhiyongii]|uniref:hypothetical protein n=1 Tax=Clavibacter zhangzhiyongii TaxID=2768071 RepID=UPI0039DFBB64
MTFNSSLEMYEVEQFGPDAAHDVRIDFIDIRTAKQRQLAPTVRMALLHPEIALTMPLGARSRVQHYGLAIRWDDDFGTDQFERLRLADARVE